MRYRVLVVVPILYAAAFAIAQLAIGAGATLTVVLKIENDTGKALAALGCVVALLAFDGGDYLRRAWAWLASCFALLLASDAAAAGPIAPLLGAHLVMTQSVLTLLANAASVVGTWMLAHAWNVAGLADDESRARRRVLLGAALVVALAITGWPLAEDAQALAHGRAASLANVASDLGDTIFLALVAPILLTTIAMRGGRLAWPWGLLTASGVGWILYDLAAGIVAWLQPPEPVGVMTAEACRALGCVYMLCAGLAQRSAVK